MESTNYKFIAAALTASKTLIYQMHPSRPSEGGVRDRAEQPNDSGTSGIAVRPNDKLGRFFETEITLQTKSGKVLTIDEAICSVMQPNTIVKTVLPGLKGSIKEWVAPGDCNLTIVVGLVALDPATGAMIDEYPADGVQIINEILSSPEALQVDSAFLALFDINRIVIEDFKIDQMTYSNRQVVTIKALSDEDYTINYNEY